MVVCRKYQIIQLRLSVNIRQEAGLMSDKQYPEVQIVLPVHNEEKCIEAVVREIYDEISARVPVEFIICEDGSKDKTKEILQKLSHEIPMKLVMSYARKGYSQAIIDGFKEVTADYVLVIDSDGVYSPKDFWKFYEQKENYDIIIGWRKLRMDTTLRRLLSWGFKQVYQTLLYVPVHDPSCGFLLVKKNVIKAVLNDLGILNQGFEWEFVARVYGKGFNIKEIPVKHKERLAGTTKVYQMRNLTGIAISHVSGLFQIRRQMKNAKQG
jgi:glycosyltransferase involved in cell wall biosynthesis